MEELLWSGAREWKVCFQIRVGDDEKIESYG